VHNQNSSDNEDSRDQKEDQRQISNTHNPKEYYFYKDENSLGGMEKIICIQWQQ